MGTLTRRRPSVAELRLAEKITAGWPLVAEFASTAFGVQVANGVERLEPREAEELVDLVGRVRVPGAGLVDEHANRVDADNFVAKIEELQAKTPEKLSRLHREYEMLTRFTKLEGRRPSREEMTAIETASKEGVADLAAIPALAHASEQYRRVQQTRRLSTEHV